MSVLIIFIKLIAVFDLLVIAVYFGGDILSTMLNKLRRKAKQEDSFDFSQDAVTVSLSIDSIRQLYSGDAADFVEDKILPNAEKTMAVLTDQEQTAARLLLSALIGFLAAEAPMDEQSFPMVMELLNCMEGEKEDGCQDAVESLLEDAVRNTHRHEEDGVYGQDDFHLQHHRCRGLCHRVLLRLLAARRIRRLCAGSDCHPAHCLLRRSVHYEHLHL